MHLPKATWQKYFEGDRQEDLKTASNRFQEVI